MNDPFEIEENPEALIIISTGIHDSREIYIYLLDSFIKKTLEVGNNGNIYSPIQRSKIKTFEDMSKKTRLKCRSGEVLTVYINPEVVFKRAFILANSHDDVTVEKILSFPIGPVPTSLFHDDGTMRKMCVISLSLRPQFDMFLDNLIDHQLYLYEMEWHCYNQRMSNCVVHSEIWQ